MIAPKPKRATRDRSQLVRLTADERARMDRLVALYGGTRSDVLRAGIGALEREHAKEDPAYPRDFIGELLAARAKP